MSKILILGGYGNFGKRISAALAKAGFNIVIAGRDANKAKDLAGKLNTEMAVFDIYTELKQHIQIIKPKVVINNCGPFQNANYSVAKICIESGVHYLDIADDRKFVCGITELDNLAKKHNVLVVSGASTVPCLSSAVVDAFKNEFSEIESLKYGISPGQKTERGLATTKSILSYLGKELEPAAGKVRYGWQDLYQQEFPELGKRWMGNCDIPDLNLFPDRYKLKSIQFSAGMESAILHLGIWAVSWLIRWGLPVKLENYAAELLYFSHYFDFLGSADGGMHVIIKGKGHKGEAHRRKWFIIAKNGDGPQIPCIPTIILAKKLLNNEITYTGAMPCVGMIGLSEYLKELDGFAINHYDLD
ncbi:MAG: hypothetical protein K0R02_418 [Rickettsiaceae bacterium]|jgi:hypothetical protein|nr:hypothetical protein [Rickettsiaceae bacterium]